MSTKIKAVYKDGVFKPEDQVSLEEGTKVELVLRAKRPIDPDDPTGWKAIDRLIGAGKAITPDASERHDEYLYSDPQD